jgi:hypothetical protein
MKQNIQSLIEDKFNNAQYLYIYRDHPTHRSNSRGGFYLQAKGDYLNRVHSDQMVLEIVTGRLSSMSCGQKQYKRAIRLESALIRWFL